MRVGNLFPCCFLRAVVLVTVAALLSSCAGRPKPLDPTRPFNVTEVRVTAQSTQDFGFADRLQQRLEATVGRGTSDIGQTSALRIVVLDRDAQTGPIALLGGAVSTASLNLLLVDAATGQVMRSRAWRASAANGVGNSAETALIDRLVDDTRALLGLSGYPPHPVSGAKREVALPLARPDELTDAALLSADPLLNGTVTPTTPDADLEPKAALPVLDISRPLLEPARPAGETDAVPAAMSPVVVVPQGLELPARPPEIPPVSSPAAAAGDDPCIITLDNDCSDPDNRQVRP